MNFPEWVPDCLPIENRIAVWLMLVAVWFVSSCLIGARLGCNQFSGSIVQLIMFHVVFVPYLAYDYISKFQHPEQLDAIPLPMFIKDPNNWQFVAMADVCILLFLFVSLRKLLRQRRADRWLKVAIQFREEGNHDAAELALQKMREAEGK